MFAATVSEARAEMPPEVESRLVSHLQDWTTADYCLNAGLISADEYEEATAAAREFNLGCVEQYGWSETAEARRSANRLVELYETIENPNIAMRPYCIDLLMRIPM